jgi:hydroxymethylbilane synthase
MAATELRIGTRGSPLALYQANEVKRLIGERNGLAADQIEIRTIRTSGDRIQDRPLSEAGGKGLFTKEIEEALLAGEIDCAVHSAKDMPTRLPDGLVIATYLEREDVSDALIAPRARTLMALPEGALVGTSSLRRQALIKRLRPDLRTELLRGNVETRLRKIEEGKADATLLALAGLKRLGLERHATEILPPEHFLPAIGQGAICVESRAEDRTTAALLETIGDADTAVCVEMERTFLAVLEGSCRTPIAGHATLFEGAVAFRGLVLRPDGSESHETTRWGAAAEGLALAQSAGEELKAKAGPSFFQPA